MDSCHALLETQTEVKHVGAAVPAQATSANNMCSHFCAICEMFLFISESHNSQLMVFLRIRREGAEYYIVASCCTVLFNNFIG
jgi:hypothetical protein